MDAVTQVPWLSIAAGIAITIGTLLMLTGGIALLRLGDSYSRMNGVAKAATLGIIFILIGSFLLMPSWENAWKVALAVWLQLISAPVAAFAIGRFSYRAWAPLTEQTRVDQLEGRVPNRIDS